MDRPGQLAHSPRVLPRKQASQSCGQRKLMREAMVQRTAHSLEGSAAMAGQSPPGFKGRHDTSPFGKQGRQEPHPE